MVIKEVNYCMGQAMNRRKYLNKKTEIDGIVFDSQKEAFFYLKYRNDKNITDLKCQIPFNIVINNKKICKYIADFTYIKDGKMHVIDIKSDYTVKLPVFRLKKKLVEALYNIEIEIVN